MKAGQGTATLPLLDARRNRYDVALAGGILGILFVILMPLPSGLVDPLLILNLTVSVVVLLTAACVSRALDFSVFPSLLLVATFFRLALNIATTRLILGNAAEGPLAAGNVVRTFGDFVAGANPIVGLIIFMVIVIVQFVVITKGATRVSEVAARFQLDAMPGKQLSIDGDLAAGLIDRETARTRRQEVTQEADFYGAMDGASKFVRGDAVAGLVVVLINIVGGIAVGCLYHDMTLGGAVNVFSRLTIGDGLVSQVPALMVSIAAALLVTRSAASEHLGKDLGRQVFSNDQVLFVAAVFLLLLLPTGLPVIALVVGAGACGACGYLLRRERQEKREVVVPEVAPETAERRNTTPSDVRPLLRVEPIALEVGYRLLRFVDEGRGGDLMDRVALVRERVALDLGFVVPAVQVRDTRRLAPTEYSIKLRGNSFGRWRLEADGLLAVAKLPGVSALDGTDGPELRGMPSYWIAEPENLADVDDYDFLHPAAAVAAHLEAVIRAHAAEILTREEISQMVASLRQGAPCLVDDLIPSILKISDLHKVLQGLLREGVSVRDLESILETLGGLRDKTFQPEWIEEVRRSLARSVCAPAVGPDGKIHVVLLDSALEEFLSNSLKDVDGDTVLDLDPQTTESLCVHTAETLNSVHAADLQPAVLCSPRVRPHLSLLVRQRIPRVTVLSYGEVVDDDAVEVHGSVSLSPARATPISKTEVSSER